MDDSLSIVVYAADPDAVRALVGSKDDGLLAAATSKLKFHPWSHFRSIRASNPMVPCLHWLVMGGKAPSPDDAEFCGHALRLLVSFDAKSLPVSAWSSFTRTTFDEIDAALRALGSKVKIGAQLSSGAPVRLPPKAKVPIIGTIRAADIQRAQPLLADAIASAKSASAPGDQCVMTRGKSTWTASISGTDFVQVWKASGAPRRVVNCFTNDGAALRQFEIAITDRQAEGYRIQSRSERPKGRKTTKKPPVDAKVIQRLEEVAGWYATAARMKRALVAFSW